MYLTPLDVVDCDPTSCNSNGECIEVVGGGSVCRCEDGWRGEYCDKDAVDDCLSEPCKNGGSCNDGANNYTCNCSPPWTGRLCESGKCDIFLFNNKIHEQAS